MNLSLALNRNFVYQHVLSITWQNFPKNREKSSTFLFGATFMSCVCICAPHGEWLNTRQCEIIHSSNLFNTFVTFCCCHCHCMHHLSLFPFQSYRERKGAGGEKDGSLEKVNRYPVAWWNDSNGKREKSLNFSAERDDVHDSRRMGWQAQRNRFKNIDELLFSINILIT